VATILGISAFYHDSAAALVRDGHIVAAAQEERFSRIKHDAAFPTNAVQYCLREAGITPADLDYVAFYEKPLRKLDRLLETYLAFAPRGFRNFGMALPAWLRDRLWIARTIRSSLGIGRRPPLVFTEHHESHAASAFFPSPFEEAAILTLDGVGEWSTTTFGVGRGNRITLTDELTFPHSLGLLYSAFTYYCGFKVNSGEYKLMGLAPYGRPVFRDIILEHLVDLKRDGSFWLNMDCFNYCQGLTMTSARFEHLFGGPPRAPESDLTQRHMDLAASIQVVTEEIVLRMAAALFERTRLTNVVLAGGVALNCVANGRLLREGPFEDLWVQPAAGDAGGALGAALFTWYQLLDKPRARTTVDAQQGSLLGPAWSDEEVAAFVRDSRLMARRFTCEADLLDEVTALLAAGRVVGWFQGRMEFGPRALGNRSILGDPRAPGMQATMNLKVKFRESFRSFAPAVLKEEAS
jgi:carbamoyltransferase